MIPKNRTATHPGVILLEEFLIPLNITQEEFATRTKLHPIFINDFVKGSGRVNQRLAVLFGLTLQTTPGFWMNLQDQYDRSSSPGS